MGIDFRVIRMRLLRRLERLRWRVLAEQGTLLSRSIEMLEDKTVAEEFESVDQEIAEKTKSLHEKALFTSVGQALSFWAAMEEMLVIITGLLLGTDFSKAGVIMYNIINFHVWLTIIGELLLMDAEYIALRTKWNKLSDRLRRLKTDRDRLAHHTVHSRANVATVKSETHLRPARFDTRRQSQNDKPMDFDQIHVFISSLSKVMIDLAHSWMLWSSCSAHREKNLLNDKTVRPL